ncbi:MAG TPA: beta-L-arabinofuranosidase domain-containing protein [Opitutaceae bacterium]|jgi:hypothetical protein
MKIPLAIALLLAAVGQARSVSPVVPDALSYPPPNGVQMGGRLGQEIDLSVRNRVEAQDLEAIIQPFRDRKDVSEWRSEFWGKWITSAIEAYRMRPDPALRSLIERAERELIATQSSDGYIGAYAPENRLQTWDVWGRKYTLLGLLAWYDVSGDPACLQAARREADRLLKEAGPGHGDMFRHDAWNGMASSSVLEPMVLLYQRTGDRRYLRFCEWLIAEWRTPHGPDIERKALAGVPVFDMFPKPKPIAKAYWDGGHSKAYEMMSCFEGLLELYRMTGQPEYRDAVEAIYDNIRSGEITVIGSGSDWERWTNGANRQTEVWHEGMETCVTVTWIKLAAQLLRLTGNPRYADDIEFSSYNALLGAMAPDGSWWCHYVTLDGRKVRGEDQCGLKLNCCVANGPRALLLLPELAVMAGAEGPVINLYGQMNAALPLATGGSVRLAMNSTYPADGTVRIRLTPDSAREFTLGLRIPAWSAQTTLTVNGARTVALAGTYARIHRVWQPGDTVDLSLDVRVRKVFPPRHADLYVEESGPIVLATDDRLTAGDRAPFWIVKNGRCDYADAGNTWDARSRFTLWQARRSP